MKDREILTTSLDAARESGYRDGYEQGWKDALVYEDGYEPDFDEDPIIPPYSHY